MFVVSFWIHASLFISPLCLDIDLVITNNGERPTKENSAPLDGLHGRGSCVWFNQATLFQTSELGVETIALAKKQGMDTTCDVKGLLEKGLFPVLS